MDRPSARLAALVARAATLAAGLALAGGAVPCSAAEPAVAKPKAAAPADSVPRLVDPDALPAPRIWWPLDSVRRGVPGTPGSAEPPMPTQPPGQVVPGQPGTTPSSSPQAMAVPVPGSLAPIPEGGEDDDLPPPAIHGHPVAPTPREPVRAEPPPTSVAVTQPVAPLDPRVSVVSGPASGSSPKEPHAAADQGSELSFGLSPELAVSRVQATLPESGLEPPSPEVRRWTFAAPEGGLTWESEESTKEGDWIILRGQVDIRAGVERIQADEVRLNQITMKLEATGNVILDRLDSRMAGNALEYDIKTNTGIVHEAFGTTGEDLSFTADIAEKVAGDKYVLRGATFTSCTQPGPIWQVKATKAIVTIDKFVYMWNPRVVFGKVPAFYLPWVAIPIRDKRSTGFMIPKIGSSSTRGFTASEEFFWAVNRQVDVTVGATWWEKAGYRADLETRWFGKGMPEYGFIKGAFVHQTEEYLLSQNTPTSDIPELQDRYDVVWEHRQSFGEWDLTATGEVGSDQFVKYDLPGDEGIGDLRPIFNQRLTLQRTWGRHSLNIFAENNEEENELATAAISGGNQPNGTTSGGKRTDIDRKLPVLEYRSSGLQLGGKKWASLSLEGSVGHVQQIEKTSYRWDYDPGSAANYPDETIILEETTLEHDYERVDFYPQFKLPLGTSWLQVIPEFNVRGTWWSRRELDPRTRTLPVPLPEPASDPQPVPPVVPPVPPATVNVTYVDGEDESLLLWGWDAGVSLEGPDFSRIFNLDALPGQRKWQHLIEPSIEFTYGPGRDPEPIILSDAYRSHWSQRLATYDAAGLKLDDGARSTARLRLVNTLRTKIVAEPGEQAKQARDWLIWTLSTDRDFENASNTAIFAGRTETSKWNDIQSDVNFKASDRVHVSLRNTYDVLNDDLTQTSLVSGLDGNWGYVDLSFNSPRDPVTLEAKPADLSLTGENWFYKGDRIRIGYDIAYKLNEPKPTQPLPPAQPIPVPTPWLYRRLVFSYYNQCIGFSLSWEDQALRGSIPREQQWIFTVSLKDLGNFLRYKKSRQP